MVVVHAAALALSSTACLMLGATNFMLAFVQGMGQQPITTIGFYWLLTGLLGMVWVLSVIASGERAKNDGQLRLLLADQKPEKEATSETLLAPTGPGGFSSNRARMQAVICMGASGTCSSIGVFFIRLALTTDNKDQGPLMSVVATDVIITTLACHFFLRERLTRQQWISVVCVFFGMVIMCFGDAEERWALGWRRDARGNSNLQRFFLGLGYAICASFCFVCSNINMKLAYRTRVTPESANLIRFTAITMCGIATIALAFCIENVEAEFVGDTTALATRWGISISAVLTGVAGRIALCKTMRYECTGISLSIIGSNSLIVLLLTAVVDHMFPTMIRLTGMFIIVAGVASMSLMAS